MKLTKLEGFLILCNIGGGFTGATVIAMQILSGAISGGFSYLIVLTFLMLYCYGIYSGFSIINRGKHWKRHVSIFSLFQIPYLCFNVFYYTFYSGCGFFIYLAQTANDWHFGFSFKFGSSYMFFLNYPEEFNQGGGVNLFPLFLILTLLYPSKKTKSEQVDGD